MNISGLVPVPPLTKIGQRTESRRIRDTAVQQEDSEKSLSPRSVASTSALGEPTTSEVGGDNTALSRTSKLTDIDNDFNRCPSIFHFTQTTGASPKDHPASPDNCKSEVSDSEPKDLVGPMSLDVRIENPRPGSPWPTAAVSTTYPTPLRAMRASRVHSTYPKGRRALIRDRSAIKPIPVGRGTRCVRQTHRKGLIAQPVPSKALPDAPLRTSLPHGDVLPQL